MEIITSKTEFEQFFKPRKSATSKASKASKASKSTSTSKASKASKASGKKLKSKKNVGRDSEIKYNIMTGKMLKDFFSN